MKYVALPLALSVALWALDAAPGAAQMRRSANAAPSAAAASTTRPRTELRVFIGPAFEGGSRAISVTHSRNRSVTTVTGTAPNTTTTVDASPSINDFTTFGEGFGVLYGVEGTWWGADRLGLSANLFGAYVGAGQSTTVLSLNNQPANTFDIDSPAGITTTVTETFAITPNVTGAPGGGYGVSIGVPGGSPAAATQVNTSYTGFSAPAGAPAFLLRTGSNGATPATTYASTGGANYVFGRSFWLNDIGLNGQYLLWDAPGGAVSLFGGFTIPTGVERRSMSAKTVGANGQGDVATETETTSPDAANTATTTRSWRYNETYTSDTSLLAIGPIIGVNASYNLGAVQVYSQLGYAPVLVGSATTNALSVVSNEATVSTTVTGTVPGYTAGTTVSRNNSRTPTPSATALSGSEALGSLGLGFGYAGYRLFVEGTARSYMFAGINPELLYGLKLGGAFAF